MAKKVIKCGLSRSSIDKAIKELEAYRDGLQDKCEEFVRRLCEVGVPVIDQRMNEAQFTLAETTESGKEIYKGSDTTHQTNIKVENEGNHSIATLTVSGTELLFIEFGAGVYYNGEAGSSPHPKGQELGYRIGYYGKGHGKQKVWGYYDEGGELILTHGVQATMPVWNASLEIQKQIFKIAKEVFGRA